MVDKRIIEVHPPILHILDGDIPAVRRIEIEEKDQVHTPEKHTQNYPGESVVRIEKQKGKNEPTLKYPANSAQK